MARMVEEFMVRLPDSGEVVVVRREAQAWRKALALALARAARVLKPQDVPLRWAAVMPQDAGEDIIQAADCYSAHIEVANMWRIGSSVRGVPGGTIGIKQSPAMPGRDGGMTAIAFNGLVFNAEYVEEASAGKPIGLEETERLANETLVVARALYKRIKLPEDTLLFVSLGIDNVLNYRMRRANREGLAFPDEQFRFEHVAEMATLNVDELKKAIEDQIIWDFGVPV